jgi:hypothetical protein
MFTKIQRYKKLGLKKSQAAKKLEIDFKPFACIGIYLMMVSA